MQTTIWVMVILTIKNGCGQCPAPDEVDIRSTSLFEELEEQALPGVENCCCFLTNPEEPSLCPVPQTNRDGTQETTTTPTPIKAIGPRNPFDLLENAPDYEDEFSSTTTETTNKSEQNFAFAVPRVFLPEFIPETVKTLCPPNYQKCCYETEEMRNQVVLSTVSECRVPVVSTEPVPEWNQPCSETDLPGKQCGERPDFETIPNLPFGMASPEEFPWICIILDRSNNLVGSCVIIPLNSGNDISQGSEIVLTVAHKAIEYVRRPRLLKVRVRDNYLCKDKKAPEKYNYIEFDIQEIIVHPGYSRTRYNNNIAALRLDKRLNLNDVGINAACIPTCPDMFDYKFQNNSGVRCWIAGWGRNRESNKLQSYLRKVDLPIFDTDLCNRTITKEVKKIEPDTNFVLDEGELCAGGELNKDACNGDGGAPLVCQAKSKRWYVVGLVAWGLSSKCGVQGIPGIYTKISHYKEWIDGLQTGGKAIGIRGGI